MAIKRMRGFSLIELSLVLTLASVITGVTISYVVSTRATSLGNALRTELGAVTNLASEQLASGVPRSDVTTATLWASPGLPSAYKRPGNVLVNASNGLIAVSATTATTSVWPVTQIAMDSIPSAQCITLIQGVQDRYDEISVDGTVLKNTTGAGTTVPTTATISAACNAAPRATAVFRMVK